MDQRSRVRNVTKRKVWMKRGHEKVKETYNLTVLSHHFSSNSISSLYISFRSLGWYYRFV